MKPDISIIIPAYNVERYVKAAVESALAQQFVKVEVIVVNDGSSDSTASVLATLVSDPRVTVISQGNTGPSVSRNAGIARSQGRYIGFLDADDLWDSNKARLHVDLLEAESGVDISYSWWRIIDEAGALTQRTNTKLPKDLSGGLSFEGLIVENFTGTASTLVCRREAITAVNGFDENLRSNVDLDVLLRMSLLRHNNIALVPQILTSYRIHGNQITSNWRRMHENWERVISKFKAIAPLRVAAIEHVARARVTRYFAYLAYCSGDYSDARRLVAKAWRAAPQSLFRDRRAWLTTAAITATFLPAKVHMKLVVGAKHLLGRT